MHAKAGAVSAPSRSVAVPQGTSGEAAATASGATTVPVAPYGRQTAKMEGPWSSRSRATMTTTGPVEAPQLSLPLPAPAPPRGSCGPTRWSLFRVRTKLFLHSLFDFLLFCVRACVLVLLSLAQSCELVYNTQAIVCTSTRCLGSIVLRNETKQTLCA